jgi:hypothetical protein
VMSSALCFSFFLKDDAGGGGIKIFLLMFFSVLNILARREEGEDLISLRYLLRRRVTGFD